MQKLNLKATELKAITWMDNVEGLAAFDLGNGMIRVAYEIDPTCQFMDAVIDLPKNEVLLDVLNTTDKLN